MKIRLAAVLPIFATALIPLGSSRPRKRHRSSRLIVGQLDLSATMREPRVSSSMPESEPLHKNYMCVRERTKKELQRIRQLAGGKESLPELMALVEAEEWTATELSATITPQQPDGKSVLHIAAWYGGLENVRWLLELGCNVNAVATGQYTYGKTPFFFACTKARDDVCLLLLEHGANVCVVNNKGQSVLSLASTHLKPGTIQAIQQAETAFRLDEWQNYRVSHSDGLVYGDLDPRFLDRALTPEDKVAALAINPTTTEMRRGNFARNNPSRAKKKAKKRQRKRHQKVTPPEPTTEDWHHYDQIWKDLEPLLSMSWRIFHEETSDSVGSACGSEDREQKVGLLLLKILHFWEYQRCSWIPEASRKLEATIQGSGIPLDDDSLHELFRRAISALALRPEDDEKEKATTALLFKQKSLLERLVSQALGTSNDNANDEETPDESDTIASKNRPMKNTESLPPGTCTQFSTSKWNQAWAKMQTQFSTDPKAILQNPNRDERHLSLPSSPIWIDSIEAIEGLLTDLQEALRAAIASEDTPSTNPLSNSPDPCMVIALDSEWCEQLASGVQVATLQIAWTSSSANHDVPKEGVLYTCVIDLLTSPGEDSDTASSYHRSVADFIHWIFHQDAIILLWFAMWHDIPKLSSYVMNKTGTDNLLPTQHCLDLQVLLAQYQSSCFSSSGREDMEIDKSNLPGLKACSEMYLSNPSSLLGSVQEVFESSRPLAAWSLYKKEQCSDWARRPLSQAQMEYAGLDAAVLLVLLAQLSESPFHSPERGN